MIELAKASSGPPLILRLHFLHLLNGNLIYRSIMDSVQYQIVTASL